jgi:hypothetical protein
MGSVPYPAPLRDVLLELAITDVYRAKWSSAIHDEWINALIRNEPHRDRVALERTRALMDRATRDCPVEGYEALIPSLLLPDMNARKWELPQASIATRHRGRSARNLRT